MFRAHAFVIAGMSLLVHASGPPDTGEWARQGLTDPATLSRAGRTALIQEELARIESGEAEVEPWAREWAGEYYCGDGLGMNVRILLAPDAGVVYTWHGCLGLYASNHGEIVRVFEDGVLVDLAEDPAPQHFGFMHPRLFFVRWGDQRFLVPESQMLDFVNAFNEGGYSRANIWNAPRRGETRRRFHAPQGRPELPEQYASLLRHHPVRLTIVGVEAAPDRTVTGDVKRHEFTLRLRGGLDVGAFEGMEIPFRPRHDNFGTVEITGVWDDRSEGVLTVYAGDSILPPAEGMVLTLGAGPDPAPGDSEIPDT